MLENPFSKKCENCQKDIWEVLKKEAEKLNAQCATNTYVWIEKFKE